MDIIKIQVMSNTQIDSSCVTSIQRSGKDGILNF